MQYVTVVRVGIYIPYIEGPPAWAFRLNSDASSFLKRQGISCYGGLRLIFFPLVKRISEPLNFFRPRLLFFKVRLVLAGGARNSEDEGRVTDLRNLCKHLAVEDNVEFKARQRPIPPQKKYQKYNNILNLSG